MHRFTISKIQQIGLLLVIAGSLLVGACSTSALVSSTPSQPAATTVIGTATPALAPGTYVFVRNGDLWVRAGYGFSTTLTSFHLGIAPNTWGDFAWSADNSKLAFTLYAPPIAPGTLSGDLSQQMGTVFIADIPSHNITPVGVAAGLLVPLLGHHIAWLPDNTLLVSTHGNILHVIPSINPTIIQIDGPQNVWDIAVRGSAIWYSSVTQLQKNGIGQAQIRSFQLNTPSKTDTFVATLGPTVLPPSQCGVLLCLPDPVTPYVPYGWSVNRDGSQLAYQTSTMMLKPGIVPQIADLLAQSNFTLLSLQSQKHSALFQGVQPPAAPVALQFSPDGSAIVLALAITGTTFISPYLQSIPTDGPIEQPISINPPAALSDAIALSGPISWTPDGSSFALTVTTANQESYAVNFTLQGQSTISETNAMQIYWSK